MVGINDLVRLAEWLDPVATVLVGATILIYIRMVIQPRLKEVEANVKDRDNRLDDADLTTQEQNLLIDHNAERLNAAENAVERLKNRARRLEQAYAAEHNRPPRDMTRRDPPPADPRRDPRDDDDADQRAAGPGADGDDGDRPDPDGSDAATRRCQDRVARILSGQPPDLPVDQPQLRQRHRQDQDRHPPRIGGNA
jgi:hypothetical protein